MTDTLLSHSGVMGFLRAYLEPEWRFDPSSKRWCRLAADGTYGRAAIIGVARAALTAAVTAEAMAEARKPEANYANLGDWMALVERPRFVRGLLAKLSEERRFRLTED